MSSKFRYHFCIYQIPEVNHSNSPSSDPPITCASELVRQQSVFNDCYRRKNPVTISHDTLNVCIIYVSLYWVDNKTYSREVTNQKLVGSVMDQSRKWVTAAATTSLSHNSMLLLDKAKRKTRTCSGAYLPTGTLLSQSITVNRVLNS